MDNKKAKRGRARSFGGHTSGSSRKKPKNMDDSDKEERDRMEAASVLSSLRFLTPQRSESEPSVSNVKSTDNIPKIPVTHKISGQNHGNSTSPRTAPSIQEMKHVSTQRGSGRASGPAPQGVLSEQANKFILMHLYNSLLNRQGKSDVQSYSNDSGPSTNLPSESIIPKSEAARKVSPVNYSRTISLPSVLYPSNSINKNVAAALRNSIPASTRDRAQTWHKPIETTGAVTAITDLTSKAPGQKSNQNTMQNDAENLSKKTDSSDNSLPLKKRRVLSHSGSRANSPPAKESTAGYQLDYNAQTDVKNLLQLAQRTQMTSMISETPNHRPYTGDGFKPIDPSASLRVLSDVKQALTPDEDGDLPLHVAVVHRSDRLVRRFVDIMTMSGKSVDRYNKLMQTPLHLAVLVRQTDIIGTLLSVGANPNLVDRHGYTAMHLAVEKGYYDCLETILEYSRHVCDLSTRNFEGYTPLHTTVEQNDMEMMIFLVKHGANIDGQDGKAGRSISYYAIEHGHTNMFKYLHEMGANFELPNYAGITPIMVAQSFNSQKFTDVVVGIIGRGQEDKQSDDAVLVQPKKLPLPRLPGKAGFIAPEVFGLSRSNSMEDVKPAPRLQRSLSSTPVDLSVHGREKTNKTPSSPTGSPPLLSPRNVPQFKPWKLVERHAVLVERLQSKKTDHLPPYANLSPEQLKLMFAAMKAGTSRETEKSASQSKKSEKPKGPLKSKPEYNPQKQKTAKVHEKQPFHDEQHALLQKIKTSSREALLGLIRDNQLKEQLLTLTKSQRYSDEQMDSIRKNAVSLVKRSSAHNSQTKINGNDVVIQRKQSDTGSESMEVDKLNIREESDMQNFVKVVRNNTNTAKPVQNDNAMDTTLDEGEFKLSQGFDTASIESSEQKAKISRNSPSVQNMSRKELDRHSSDLDGGKTEHESSFRQSEFGKMKTDLERGETSSVEVQEVILSSDEDVEDKVLVIDEKVGDEKGVQVGDDLLSCKSDESTDSATTDKLESSRKDIKEDVKRGSSKAGHQIWSLKSGSKGECEKSSPNKTDSDSLVSFEFNRSLKTNRPDNASATCLVETDLFHKSVSTRKVAEAKTEGTSKSPVGGNSRGCPKNIKSKGFEPLQDRLSNPSQVLGGDTKANKIFEEMMCKVHEKTDWETESLASCTPLPLAKFDHIITEKAEQVASVSTPPRLSKLAEAMLSRSRAHKNAESKPDAQSISLWSRENEKFNNSVREQIRKTFFQEGNKRTEVEPESEKTVENKDKHSLDKKKSETDEIITKKEGRDTNKIDREKIQEKSDVNKMLDDSAQIDGKKSDESSIDIETKLKENQKDDVHAEEDGEKGNQVQEPDNVKSVNVSKAHTLYFFDGVTYRSVKVYIDDSEASSEQFRRMFTDKLNSSPSVFLGTGQSLASTLPGVPKLTPETVTSKSDTLVNRELKTNKDIGDNTIEQKERNVNSSSDSSDISSPGIPITSSLPRSNTDNIASTSKSVEAKSSHLGTIFGSATDRNSLTERIIQSAKPITTLNNSLVLYPNTSFMNLTSVVTHSVPPQASSSGPRNTVQELLQRARKAAAAQSPAGSQTGYKPADSSQSWCYPRTFGSAAGKSSAATSEGTITRINPDIKSKLSKALQSPSRKLNIVKTDPLDPSEKVLIPRTVSKSPVSGEANLRLPI